MFNNDWVGGEILNKYKNLIKNPIVLYGRNCYNVNEVGKLDIKYYSYSKIDISIKI